MILASGYLCLSSFNNCRSPSFCSSVRLSIGLPVREIPPM
nr:MAG TPA: hypothetical protein [Caudoviricetes sp.]